MNEPHFYGRKTYYAGRWWIRGDEGVWSVRAYVSPPFHRKGGLTPRVSMRGPINRYVQTTR